MTNNMTRREFRRTEQLTELGYSTREAEETIEFERTAPVGSHFANALAFIVDSLGDEETPITTAGELLTFDRESMLEFGDMYNFTLDALEKAVVAFQAAVLAENEGMKGL